MLSESVNTRNYVHIQRAFLICDNKAQLPLYNGTKNAIRDGFDQVRQYQAVLNE